MTDHAVTRADAHVRAELLTVRSYDVALDLTDGRGGAGDGTFRSVTTVTFDCATPGATTHIDMMPSALRAAWLNGSAIDVSRWDGARLPLHDLAAENVVVVDGDFAYSTSGEGLHRFVDPVDDAVYLYAMNCIAEARRMYACFDQPDLKATFTVHVTAPESWQVVANGAVASVEAAAGGATTTHFATTAPIATYITTVAAGPYHRVGDTWHGPEGDVELGVYCRASLAEHLDADEILAVTKAGFDFYRREFDYPYPFDKYDQVFAPEFNAGAMENAGAVVLRDEFVFQSRVSGTERAERGYVVLHELAHMWFGNLVTTRWWGDIWLNESFATFVSYLAAAEATRWTTAWTDFALVEKTDAYRQDQFSTTHPIVADIPDTLAAEVNFDGITYAKGASVLKQLVAYVGRDTFFSALRGYFREHEYDNATLADLLTALQRASGRDLTAWSAQWLETAHVNTLLPTYTTDPDDRLDTFTVHQAAVTEHPTLRTHRTAIGCYTDTGGRLERTDRVDVEVTGERTEVPALRGRSRPDLVLVNDDDLGYLKVRFDARSLHTVLHRLTDIADPLTRAVCWSALWDMTRDGELSASTYLDVVHTAVHREGETAIVESLLANLDVATRRYLPAEHIPAALNRLAAAAWTGLQQAAPGSDHQLAWFRAFAGAAGGTPDAGRLRSLYTSETAVEGLSVDLDARWRMLHGLLPHGAASETEIDAELDRQPTSAAQRYAATAHALLPTAEAKARTWELVTTDDTLPTVTRQSYATGFWHPAHEELLTPYVATYFTSLDDVWRRYDGGIIARELTYDLYPGIVTQDVADRAADWLDHEDRPPAQRRLVVECHEEVVRALRNRAGTDISCWRGRN